MKNILVVSHDAGGAEIVSAWKKRNLGEYNFVCLLAGPAIAIFRRKFDKINLVTNNDVIFKTEYDLVITGSSWASDLERIAIASAKKQGIIVATYLDHWTNYHQRFQLNGHTVLPDEIWVGDEYALKLASKEFGSEKIKFVHNCYFDDVLGEIEDYSLNYQSIPEETKNKILYICEPRTMNYGNPDFWGYTEYEALEGYLKYLINSRVCVEKLILRLHPSEHQDKYDEVIRKYHNVFPIEISQEDTLSKNIAWADWVVVCDSMAMYIAGLADKKVYSCIPKHGRALSIPDRKIERIFMDC